MRAKKGFTCVNCYFFVPTDTFIGTAYRNHCPKCLWSFHNDPACFSPMEPLGLTFKREGWDKFTKKPKQGEIMVVHHCLRCGKISINRIAADDQPEEIIKILQTNKLPKDLINIKLLKKQDLKAVKKQLFGD